MYTQLRPSDESLTNYVALLWVEFGHPWSIAWQVALTSIISIRYKKRLTTQSLPSKRPSYRLYEHMQCLLKKHLQYVFAEIVFSFVRVALCEGKQYKIPKNTTSFQFHRYRKYDYFPVLRNSKESNTRYQRIPPVFNFTSIESTSIFQYCVIPSCETSVRSTVRGSRRLVYGGGSKWKTGCPCNVYSWQRNMADTWHASHIHPTFLTSSEVAERIESKNCLLLPVQHIIRYATPQSRRR
jgi:hypothetical protein